MSSQPSIESPRMQILNEALERGDAGVLESFWDEMRQCGTPLIEPIEGDDESSLVTFVWRETDPVLGVGVISLITKSLPQFRALSPERANCLRSGGSQVQCERT